MSKETLEISWGAILRIVVAFFAFYLVYLIKDILILSLFGLVISIIFEIPIRFLSRKIPRGLAVAFLYLFVFAGISFLVYLPAQNIVAEIKNFINLFPVYFEQVSPSLRQIGFQAFEDMEKFVSALDEIVNVMTTNILNVLFSIFGGIASTAFVMSISIFFSVEGKNIEEALILFFSKKDHRIVKSLWRNGQKKVGFWFLKTILGSFFVGLISYASFLILKVNYPLSLALVGGALNFVPMVGPFIASFFMLLVLAMDSLPKALFAILAYTIIQQIENNIVGPLLTKKLTGISPVLVLISLAAGAQLFGLLGALLMVPVVGLITEFTKGLLEKRREQEAEA